MVSKKEEQLTVDPLEGLEVAEVISHIQPRSGNGNMWDAGHFEFDLLDNGAMLVTPKDKRQHSGFTPHLLSPGSWIAAMRRKE